jgi:hypothetical protein
MVAATLVYLATFRRSLRGAHGGSPAGLIFAGVGSAMILVALLLALRKRYRTLRIGKAYHWMQAHIWLGLLSYPMILFHAGFALGGPLTAVLMALFTVIIISGIAGLWMQQVIPSKMLRDVPAETIFEQIHRVLMQLREEAGDLIGAAVARKEQPAFEVEMVPAGAPSRTPPTESTEGEQILQAFYDQDIRPYLEDRFPRTSRLASENSSAAVFRQFRALLQPALCETLNDLQSVVDERRQLRCQQRLHRILHGWLFVHVPLSYALIVLSVIHAVVALKYTTVG